jgi:hypothetical protein
MLLITSYLHGNEFKLMYRKRTVGCSVVDGGEKIKRCCVNSVR